MTRPKQKTTPKSKNFYSQRITSLWLRDSSRTIDYSTKSFIQILKGEKTKVEFSEGFQVDELCKRISEHFDATYFTPDRRAGAIRKIMEEHLLALPTNSFARFERDYYYPADRNIATMYSEQFRQMFLENYRTSSLLVGRNVPRSVQNELTREFMERSVTMKEIFNEHGGSFEKLMAGSRNTTVFITDFLKRSSEILKGKYIIASDGTEKIKIDRGRHVELKRASSGQQSVVRILQELAILNSKRIYTYRTIEEPEVHLFPAAQNQLTELIVMTHYLTESEFLLTTHSPYFVATFNNSLYAAKAAEFEQEEVEQIGYPSHLRLPSKNFIAYLIKDGKAIPIYQPEDALTSINELDAVSLEIGEKFSQLAEIVQLNETIST